MQFRPGCCLHTHDNMLMCVCAFVCAHAAMLMTVVHTYHMSAPLRLCIYMYEWGRANGKQHQLRPFCVCLKEKKTEAYFVVVRLLWATRRQGQQRKQLLKTAHVLLNMQVCGRTPEAPGTEQGPASQTACLSVYSRDRDQHTRHITWKKKTSMAVKKAEVEKS